MEINTILRKTIQSRKDSLNKKRKGPKTPTRKKNVPQLMQEWIASSCFHRMMALLRTLQSQQILPPSATLVHQAGPDLNYPAQMTNLTVSIWKLPKRIHNSLQPIEVFNDPQGIKKLFSALTSVAQLVQHAPKGCWFCFWLRHILRSQAHPQQRVCRRQLIFSFPLPSYLSKKN